MISSGCRVFLNGSQLAEEGKGEKTSLKKCNRQSRVLFYRKTKAANKFFYFSEASSNNRRVLWQYQHYNTELYETDSVDWPRAKHT